jgi:hypothetical protein
VRTLRWLVLLPAYAATFYLAIAATIATHYLVEQHLCPAADFDRGICSNRTLGVVLECIKHGGAALTVFAVAGVVVIVAPSHKRPVLWAALALVLVIAAYFGYAGTAGSLFVAALAGGVLAATVILRRLRPPLQTGLDQT